jgi:hypothetical protein
MALRLLLASIFPLLWTGFGYAAGSTKKSNNHNRNNNLQKGKKAKTFLTTTTTPNTIPTSRTKNAEEEDWETPTTP